MITPIVPITYFRNENIDLRIKMDDCYPHYGGGNKARKAFHIKNNIITQNCDAVVTTGGIQSNHCRAVALMAARERWKCKIIYHGEKKRFERSKGNKLLVKMSGADIEVVHHSEISACMDLAMETYSREGFTPYYLHGGGHEISGVIAYIEAVQEIKDYYSSEGWKPDFIILASGTGSTQAGILAGLDNIGWSAVKVFGISIGRDSKKGLAAIRELYHEVIYKQGISNPGSEIIFLDNWLFGGYENHSIKLNRFINDVAQNTGLILDPTYTGKAFWGLKELILSNKVYGNILFWHTGGILNLME